MSELEIKGLQKAYETQSVLEDLDLTVEAGSFVSILGPSGSGKTTLLRVIAGFDRADQGSVRLHGELVDDESHFVESAKRRIGYVPQDGSLFPHLSVEANVGFGLARRDRHGKRVAQLLEITSSPAGSNSASRWRAASRSSHPSCSSTNHSLHSTRVSAPPCVVTCAKC
jgi:iron(III) transport system ATP-binding protein